MKLWFGKKEEASAPAEPAEKPAPAPAAQPTPAAKAAEPVSSAPEPEPKPAASAAAPQQQLVRPQPNQRVLYYELMNGLYDAVLILDENGHVVDCNNRVKSVLGYERDEVWDLPVVKIIKGVGPQIFQQMKNALHNDNQVIITAKCTRKDGTYFLGEVSASIMHLTRENLVFCVRNIEKRMEEALRKAREQLNIAPPPLPRHTILKVKNIKKS